MKVNREAMELAMAKKCYTLNQLSQETDISTSTLSNIKNGSETKPANVGKIAKALDVSVETIVK